MQKLFFLMIMLVCMIGVLDVTASTTVVVGKVDIQKILLTVKEGEKVRNKLKKTFDNKQSQLTKQEGKIKKMQKGYKKQSLVMNDKAKMQKEQEIQRLIMDLQKKSMSYQKEIQEMEQKLKRPILEKVQKIILGVSKKAGVDMTFETTTTPVLYAKAEKDLTDAVIKAYDKKYPSKK